MNARIKKKYMNSVYLIEELYLKKNTYYISKVR